jgi:hypothetical protein
MQHKKESAAKDARRAPLCNSVGAYRFPGRDQHQWASGTCYFPEFSPAVFRPTQRGCGVQNGRPWPGESASERATADDATNVRHWDSEWRVRHEKSQGVLLMSRTIWDRSGNPTRYVSNSLGIARWQLREALHQIKRRANLGGQDRVVIYDDGRVTDANGNDIGNILDEVTNE